MKLQLAVVNISQSWSLAGDVMIYARWLCMSDSCKTIMPAGGGNWAHSRCVDGMFIIAEQRRPHTVAIFSS